MARKHYWQFLVTDEGNPVENASISIFSAGTENDVWIYTDEVGFAGTSASPQVVTNNKGYFEFWMADENDTVHGYPLSTKFKIQWSAAGVSEGYIDNVDVFSTSATPVDETDDNILKNKTLSNFLAKGWEDHKNSSLPLTPVHNIYPVNEIETGGDRNKLITNYQAHIWDYHTKRLWDGTNSTILIPNQIEDVHGIGSVTITDPLDDLVGDKNLLVSNPLANRWNDHSLDNTTDVHTQYSLVSGTRPFTGKVQGQATISGDPALTLVTKGYVDSKSYVFPIPAGSWNLIGGEYEYNIVHNLNTDYPVIMLWNTTLSPAEVVSPLSITRVDVNTTKIKVTSNVNHTVRVLI